MPDRTATPPPAPEPLAGCGARYGYAFLLCRAERPTLARPVRESCPRGTPVRLLHAAWRAASPTRSRRSGGVPAGMRVPPDRAPGRVPAGTVRPRRLRLVAQVVAGGGGVVR